MPWFIGGSFDLTDQSICGNLQANCFPLIRDPESKTKTKEKTKKMDLQGLQTETLRGNGTLLLLGQDQETCEDPVPPQERCLLESAACWSESWLDLLKFPVFFAPSSLFSKDQARQSRKRATGSYSEVSEGVNCLDKPLPVGRVEHTEPLLQSILKSHSVSSLFKLFAIWPLLVQGNGCSSSSPIIIILQILQGQGL